LEALAAAPGAPHWASAADDGPVQDLADAPQPPAVAFAASELARGAIDSDSDPDRGAVADAEDARTLGELLATPAAYAPEFTRLAMPEPEAVPELYATAENATAEAADESPATTPKHFVQVGREPTTAGFFSRLFASLIE
jgi:hypothetical protein